jgi:hypothetical protein
MGCTIVVEQMKLKLKTGNVQPKIKSCFVLFGKGVIAAQGCFAGRIKLFFGIDLAGKFVA